jgi:hypothetical protein
MSTPVIVILPRSWRRQSSIRWPSPHARSSTSTGRSRSSAAAIAVPASTSYEVCPRSVAYREKTALVPPGRRRWHSRRCASHSSGEVSSPRRILFAKSDTDQAGSATSALKSLALPVRFIQRRSHAARVSSIRSRAWSPGIARARRRFKPGPSASRCSRGRASAFVEREL